MFVTGFVHYVGFLPLIFQEWQQHHCIIMVSSSCLGQKLPFSPTIWSTYFTLKYVNVVLQVLSKGLTLLGAWSSPEGVVSNTCVPQLHLSVIMSSTSSSYSSSGETSPEDVPRGGGTIRVYLPNKQRTVVRWLALHRSLWMTQQHFSERHIFTLNKFKY